jgi:hypothetical protein
MNYPASVSGSVGYWFSDWPTGFVYIADWLRMIIQRITEFVSIEYRKPVPGICTEGEYPIRYCYEQTELERASRRIVFLEQGNGRNTQFSALC